jgi:hypothetical protein
VSIWQRRRKATGEGCLARWLRGVPMWEFGGVLLATLGGAAFVMACSSSPGGGGASDGGTDGSLSDVGADGPGEATVGAEAAPHDAAQDVTADHADGSAGEASVAADAEGGAEDGGLIDSGIASCAVVDVPPQGGVRCGNGWRDPNEECDLGDASSDGGPLSRAGCSTTCTVVDMLAEVQVADGGLDNTPRTLGGGRHPLAASDTTFSVATLETSESLPTLTLTTFTRKGVAKGAPMPISAGSVVDDQGDPVLAALPCDQYVAAWNDLNGDGSGLGIALRLVSPGAVPVGAPSFANTTTLYDQYSPDVLWTGSEVVVAWTDSSNASTGPDVVLRTFDNGLNATSGEQSLAATSDAEGDVTLAKYNGSWAAAWRDDANGLEQIRVHAGIYDWTVGPAFVPPSVTTKIALVELDAEHLIVSFSVGVDPAETGVPNASSQVWAAIVSPLAPGAVNSGPVPVSATVEGNSATEAHASANAVVIDGVLYSAWWTAAVPGDPNGEQIWFAPVGPAPDGGLTLVGSELLLPRSTPHRLGDQRGPALAETNIGPNGALVSAWDDLGEGFGSGEGHGDVVVEVIPVPIVRNGTQ